MKKTITLVSLLGLVAACSNQKLEPRDLELQRKAQTIFGSLPLNLVDVRKDKEKIELGKQLYFETKLSLNNRISCNSCHNLETYGVDNEPTSPGHDGRRGDRNSPTVYNSALNFTQFWDGRAKDLAEQAVGPILNPIEHGLASEQEALSRIRTEDYLMKFKAAFPNEKESFTYKNVGKAIEAFEKTLLTQTRFDDYLAGDINALTSQERMGLEKFMHVGCTSCHNGPGLGGSSYQKIGLMKPYPTKDEGLSKISGKRRDKFKFKVPILRNIEKTGPYFHDGTIVSLDKAIELMAIHQIGTELTKKDIADIKAFLSSLTAKQLPQITKE